MRSHSSPRSARSVASVAYATRIANFTNGGGLNGIFVLNASTIFDDGGDADPTGCGATDWFIPARSAGRVPS